MAAQKQWEEHLNIRKQALERQRHIMILLGIGKRKAVGSGKAKAEFFITYPVLMLCKEKHGCCVIMFEYMPIGENTHRMFFFCFLIE